MRAEDDARFVAKIARRGEEYCWLWTAAIERTNGYGKFWLDGAMRLAHRVAYEHWCGPIAPGRDIDHLCRNRACVNPDHLEVVSRRENVRRGLRGVLKTHCAQGHEYTPQNTAHYRGWRTCRTCNRERAAERRRLARG